MNQFGEPELLDDILDHWSSSAHCKEKEALLGKLRSFAAQRGTRITLLSGDVHQAVYTFTSSTPTYTNMVQDPGFMPQVRALRVPAARTHAQRVCEPGWLGSMLYMLTATVEVQTVALTQSCLPAHS